MITDATRVTIDASLVVAGDIRVQAVDLHGLGEMSCDHRAAMREAHRRFMDANPNADPAGDEAIDAMIKAIGQWS